MRRLEEVYGALQSHGFDRQSVIVTSMLEELRSERITELQEPGTGWTVRSRHGTVEPKG
jgi:hypothetical protein